MNEIPAHANTQYTRKSRASMLSLQARHYTGIYLSTLWTYSWLAAWHLVDPDLDANRFDKQFWLVSDSIDADQTVRIVLPAVTFVVC